jgi:hypothetical protein
MIRGESRNRASCEVSDVGITSFHACLSAAFLMEGCRAATLVTPGRALLRGGHRQTDTLHGFISRLYFTASSARHNKYCPIIEIPVSGAFHAFGSGPSIEFSASLKYTSYAPLKIINGKYQNSNGTSNSYL